MTWLRTLYVIMKERCEEKKKKKPALAEIQTHDLDIYSRPVSAQTSVLQPLLMTIWETSIKTFFCCYNKRRSEKTQRFRQLTISPEAFFNNSLSKLWNKSWNFTRKWKCCWTWAWTLTCRRRCRRWSSCCAQVGRCRCCGPWTPSRCHSKTEAN